MPIDASPAGTLDIENATLRSREIVALTNMVAGNDVVRSGGPALEVYGDPSNGGNEATLQLVSNTANTISTSFTSLTSNAGVFSVKSGTDASDNGTITFGGFSNERLRITSDGKVGVGTDDPGAPLEIFTTTQGNSSTLILKRDVSSYGGSDDGAAIEFKTRFTGNSATYGQVRIRGVDDNLSDSGEGGIAFDTLQDQVYYERMRIKHNGNMGLGVTNPVKRLHTKGETVIGTVGDNFQNELGSLYFVRGITRAGTGFGDRHHYIATRTNGATGGNYVSNRMSFYIDDGTSIDGSSHIKTMELNGLGNVIVAGSVSASGQTLTSDDRIKYNEQSVSNALTLINQLVPQKYEKISKVPASAEGVWIPTDEEWKNVKEDYTYGDEFGFIAQDVRNIPELSFLVSGEETRTDTKTSTPEEYSNLTTEEQSTYTISYLHESNVITQEKYSNLSPEEQEVSVTQYTKQFETQTPLALNYQGLFVVAIGAIKELKAKNESLEARITALENA
jgi:hypothetical protein